MLSPFLLLAKTLLLFLCSVSCLRSSRYYHIQNRKLYPISEYHHKPSVSPPNVLSRLAVVQNRCNTPHSRWETRITEVSNHKEQEAHQLVGQAKCSATQILPKAVGGGIFRRFSNFNKCRTEVAGDVISSRFMEPDVPDNRVKFGDLRLNLS